MSRRRSGWLVPLLLVLVLVAVVAAILSSGGGSRRTAATHPATRRGGVGKHHPKPKKSTAANEATPSTTQATPPANTGAGTAAVPPVPASSPIAAVEHFYWDAAAHRYGAAWALADPAFRQQLGGYDSFVAGQQGDRRIIFDSAQVTSQDGKSSTVAVRTTSIRSNGTQHCSGTVDLARSPGTWLLHQIAINCTPPQ